MSSKSKRKTGNGSIEQSFGVESRAAARSDHEEEDRQPVVLRSERVEDHYAVESVLGKGRFGTVYRCVSKQTGEAFAGKFIKKVGLRCVRRDEIQREIDVMNAVHSRRVVKLWDGFETAEFVVLMLDLATGGELFDYLAEKDTLTEDEAAKFTRHILEGIDCMHEKNIVHLDLKPENIMLKDRNKSEVVIIDLGLARDLNKGEVKVICGTPEFIAPEVLNYDPVTLATDMWAVGVIVYIMLSGCSPFLGDDDNETMANVSNGQYEFYEEYFSEVSGGAKDFIKRLLRTRPKDRSGVYECLAHPWIKPKRGKSKRSRSQIDTARLRRFNARQKWQATMEAVKLSLRMRISIGSASSWINSHPIDSLSSDSLSSENDDSQPVSEKREQSAPSSEYSDSVFVSPARQLTPGGIVKKSVYGSVPPSNDSDDEADAMYSKAGTMAKVHQLIESRNLKPTSSQGEGQSQLGEEVGNYYCPASRPLPNGCPERDKKILTQLSTPPVHVNALSETNERANVDTNQRANTDCSMGDTIADAAVLSLKQQVKTTQKQLKERPRSQEKEQNETNGFPVSCNPDSPDNVYCHQVKEPCRDSRTNVTAIADREELPTELPNDDKKTRPDESSEKPFSRAQKLRHSIIKKLRRRSSSSVDKEKSHGRGKKLEVERGESDGKLGKQQAQSKAAESIEKKKRKVDVECIESDGKLEKQQAQSKATESIEKKKRRVDVERIESDGKLEKQQAQSKAAESTEKKKRKVEVERAESDGKSEKQQAQSMTADEPIEKKKKPKKVIRIVRRVVKRKVPKRDETDKAESAMADVTSHESPVAEKRKTGTAREGLSRLIRKLSFNRGSRSNKPVVSKNRNATEDSKPPQAKPLGAADMESDGSSAGIVDSKKRSLDVPRDGQIFGKSAVPRASTLDHHEKLVDYNEQEGNRRRGHGQEDIEKMKSGCRDYGSSMLSKDRSFRSESVLLGVKKTGETTQKTGRHRLSRWESEQRVSVRERIQMYQNQVDKGDEHVAKSKSNEHVVKSVVNSKSLGHSGSVSSLKEKYEMCDRSSTEKLDSNGGQVQSQAREACKQGAFSNTDRSTVRMKALIPSVIVDYASNDRHVSSAPVTPAASPEPEDTKRTQRLRHQWTSQGSESAVNELKPSELIPPKLQSYDSWQNADLRKRTKSESPAPGRAGQSVQSSKEGSPTVNVYQKVRKEQNKEPRGMSTEAIKGVNKGLAVHKATDWKAKERAEIKKSTGIVVSGSSSSTEAVKVSAVRVGAKRESAETMGRKGCPVVSSRTSTTNRQGETSQWWCHGQQDYSQSVSPVMTKTSETTSCKPRSKVTSGDVGSRIVQWQAKSEGIDKDNFAPGCTKAGPALGHSDGATAPHISINKRSLSGGKSSTMIKMSFSVQKS